METKGWEKEDNTKMDVMQISGMDLNGNSEPESSERPYKIGIPKDFPHMIASFLHVNSTSFL